MMTSTISENSLASTVTLDTDINNSRRRLAHRNQSSPRKVTTKQSISIKNLNNSNNVRYHNERSANAIKGAEAKIQNIIQAKKVKEGRRSDIRKSLDLVLRDDNKNSKDGGGNKNEEKEAVAADSDLLISDEKETIKKEIRRRRSSSQQQRRRRQQSPNVKRRENHDYERKSPRRMVRSRSQGLLREERERERQRTSKIEDVVDDDSQLNTISCEDEKEDVEGSCELKPESTRILVRRRSKSINRNTNETTKSSAEGRLRHRSRSRPTNDRSINPKSSASTSTHRNRSRPRNDRSIDPKSSTNTSTRRSRRHRSLSRGADAIGDNDRRSRKLSNNDGDGKDDDEDDDTSVATSATATATTTRRGRRPHQKVHRNVDDDADNDNKVDDDDEKSIGSIKSVGSRLSNTNTSKRGRRPKGVRHRSSPKISVDGSHRQPSLERTSSSSSSRDQNGSVGSYLLSPGGDTKKNKNDMGQSMASTLSRHLESDIRVEQQLSKVDEVSIESSRTPLSSINPQSILLQFDPTTENLVRTVDQSNAKKTSEIIRQSDGTESEFQISELSGLPTFERKQQQLHHHHGNSLNSIDFSANGITASESHRSILGNTCSDERSPAEGQFANSRPTSFLLMGKPISSKFHGGDFSPSPSHSQNPGEATEEDKKISSRYSNNNNRWSLSSPLQRSGGGLGNNLLATKSKFIQRVQKSKLHVSDSLLNRPPTDRTRLLGPALGHQELEDDEDSVGY